MTVSGYALLSRPAPLCFLRHAIRRGCIYLAVFPQLLRNIHIDLCKELLGK